MFNNLELFDKASSEAEKQGYKYQERDAFEHGYVEGYDAFREWYMTTLSKERGMISSLNDQINAQKEETKAAIAAKEAAIDEQKARYQELEQKLEKLTKKSFAVIADLQNQIKTDDMCRKISKQINDLNTVFVKRSRLIEDLNEIFAKHGKQMDRFISEVSAFRENQVNDTLEEVQKNMMS